jgi:hypothetical protein
MDVKTTFLNENLEDDVHMIQPMVYPNIAGKYARFRNPFMG